MWDIFGTKAKHVLYRMGRDAAIDHVNAFNAFVNSHLRVATPRVMAIPLGVVLADSFKERTGPEWTHPVFMKGFVDMLQGFSDVNVTLRRAWDYNGAHDNGRGTFVPSQLMHVNVVIKQATVEGLEPVAA